MYVQMLGETGVEEKTLGLHSFQVKYSAGFEIFNKLDSLAENHDIPRLACFEILLFLPLLPHSSPHASIHASSPDLLFVM